jgi:microcystin-dependent protein
MTEAEMPLHGHPYRASTQAAGGADATGGFMLNNATVADYPAFTGTLTNTVGQQIGGTGGNGAHNNVQPTIVLNYIIKT